MKKLILIQLCILSLTMKAYGEETCELVSSDYYTTISAVDALRNQLNLIPKSCAESAAKSAFGSVDELTKSTSKLNEYWNNQNLAMQDATNFGSTVQSALQSVSSIGETLKNSTLNSACADVQSQNGLVALTTKLADVASSIVPIAMMGSVFVPALKIVNKGPIILGLVGLTAISSVVSTAGDLINSGNLEMSKVEHRRLVLKGICEFRKIRQNIDYLNSIHSGRSKVEQEKSKIELRVAELRLRFEKENPQLKTLLDFYYSQRKEMAEEDKRIAQSRVAMQKIDLAMTALSDKTGQCVLAYSIVKDDKLFKGLKKPLSEKSFEVENIDVAALLNRSLSVALFENQKKIIQSKESDRIDLCAVEVEKWRKNASDMLMQLTQINKNQVEALAKKLREDKAFLDWSKESYKLEKERQLFERVLAFMGTESVRGSDIADADLNLQIEELQNLLLGKKGIVLIPTKAKWYSKSLVGSWLYFMFDKFEEKEKGFNKQFEQLNTDINERAVDKVAQKSGLNLNDYRSAKEKLLNSQNLSLLNKTAASSNVDKNLWEKSCLELSDLESKARSAETFFNNVEYLCTFLEKENLKRPFVDQYIVDTCWGSLNVRDEKLSTIQKVKSKSTKMGSSSQRSSIVKSKLIELQCPEPTAPKS